MIEKRCLNTLKKSNLMKLRLMEGICGEPMAIYIINLSTKKRFVVNFKKHFKNETKQSLGKHL